MAKKHRSKLPDYSLEQSALNKGFCYIAGVDEVGYGCGAGPVVAAAARIPNGHVKELLKAGKVKDSKKMTPKRREEAYEELIQFCDYGIGIINNDIIDEINILEATKLAMAKAIYDLDFCDYVLVDGTVQLRENGMVRENVIKGDNKSLSIAAASVIAKVTRDNIMRELHKKFPLYSWDSNKGYLTKAHLDALEKYGPSPWHRISYRRVGK